MVGESTRRLQAAELYVRRERLVFVLEGGAQQTHQCELLASLCVSVNVGDYIEAVLDRNLAENISRVLYPNDNVRQADFLSH